eukprot:TRINITY_DN4579_c0_g1_i2.p1 TRINITY_DN4579_c0_g1~~TRINITY_DN4579_c0_g1_i2.p1  ORF type:complete len:158 (-),score=16.25 TRINITY_DN4579_c0_g1_i2:521-994(-)
MVPSLADHERGRLSSQMVRDHDDQDERELWWFFLDETGTERGPFASSAMRERYDDNGFAESDRLQVRLPEWNYYISLLELYNCERGSYFIGDLPLPGSKTWTPAFARITGTNAKDAFLQFTEESLIESAASMSIRARTSRTRSCKWSCPMFDMLEFV